MRMALHDVRMQLTRKITPLWAQKLALFLPTGWAMDALHKLVNFGAPRTAVIPHLCVTASRGARRRIRAVTLVPVPSGGRLVPDSAIPSIGGHTGKKKAIIERGFALDVELAAELNVSTNVARLVDRAFLCTDER